MAGHRWQAGQGLRQGAGPVLVGAAMAGLAGCAPQAPEEVSGRALYADYCAVCHGDGGRGDGPAAAGMTPPPVDLTLLSRANGGTFPVIRVMSYIDGYTREDRGEGMPAFGELLEGRLVQVDTGDGVLTPTPAPLAALSYYLRTLQR